VSNAFVAPSLLSADPLRLGDELASVEAAGADWHHVDVMDGHFVPNLTYGLPLVAALKRWTKLPLDVHIMVSNPDEVALDYVRAGAAHVIFHVEAARHAHRLVQAIRHEGAKAGLAVNPGTPVESVFPLLDDADLIMVMSVNPGFGGQHFIPQAVERVARLAEELARRGRARDVVIEVDGGINAETGAQVVAAGAGALVAGTYIYGASDRAAAIRSLKLPRRFPAAAAQTPRSPGKP
jgi:ribulose-phosphate 3-epimerase